MLKTRRQCEEYLGIIPLHCYTTVIQETVSQNKTIYTFIQLNEMNPQNFRRKKLDGEVTEN